MVESVAGPSTLLASMAISIFFQNYFMFFRGMVFECVETEIDCIGDLFLAELAAHIRCSLDD